MEISDYKRKQQELANIMTTLNPPVIVPPVPTPPRMQFYPGMGGLMSEAIQAYIAENQAEVDAYIIAYSEAALLAAKEKAIKEAEDFLAANQKA